VVRRAVDELCTVPGVVRVTAGVPRDAETAATWDVVIVVRFPGMAEVEAYRPHPTHRHFVDGYMAPRLEAKTGWMFEVVDGTVRDHAS
jgi:hypothetical protein